MAIDQDIKRLAKEIFPDTVAAAEATYPDVQVALVLAIRDPATGLAAVAMEGTGDLLPECFEQLAKQFNPPASTPTGTA